MSAVSAVSLTIAWASMRGSGLSIGFGWTAEFETEEDAFFAADPLADVTATAEEAEFGECCLEGFGIGDAESVVESGELLFVFADLGGD